MPFGIAPAPEIYQKRQVEVVQRVPGVIVLADDLLIIGKGKTLIEATKDHHETLKKLLQTIQQSGMKLNRKKAKVCKRQVSYYGHLLTSDGLKPDPEKIRAVIDMPKPENVKEIQCLLGMATYLAKFLPKLSEICEPMRRLTKKEVEFNWREEQQKAFDTLKQLTIVTPVLRY